MMKAFTWLASVAVGMTALASFATASVPDGWTDDLAAAFTKAKEENKAVLVEFTGSDWCPPCIMMRKNVFTKKDFVEAASKNYILVELDFPKKDPELKKKNQPFAEKYKITGFPTVILFNSDGEEFTRFTASRYRTVETFIEHINSALENKDLD